MAHRKSALILPRVLQRLLRIFLGLLAGVCTVSALFMAVDPAGSPVAGPVIGGFMLLAAAGAAAARWMPSRSLAPMLAALLALSAALRTGNALATGWGLTAPSLTAMGLTVCGLAAVAGWRLGLLLAGFSLANVAALALFGRVPSGPGAVPPHVLAATAVTSIVAGLAVGSVISSVMERFMRQARERSRRIRHLLALAADVYFEMDDRFRLVSAASQGGDPQPLTPERGRGRAPWELPQFHCEPGTLDRLRADLESQQPFRDVPVHWDSRTTGRRHAFLASGAPRFDDEGAFTGYWGVLRDISSAQRARETLAATEARYRELFNRMPTPLVLHREGGVIEANPAAAAMFARPDAAAMAGVRLMDHCADEASREVMRGRSAALQNQPPGTALPEASLRLAAGGRQYRVRGTTVMVQAEGGPARLTMFVDDTDRLAAEEAVRRSETMLSHLVATSPDLITLTELATGRYVMVNRAFEQVSGWSAQEAIGRTSIEIGIWGSSETRETFVALMREKGRVADLPIDFVTKTGGTAQMLVSAARFVMDGRDYMVINAHDITERERQRLLREAILAGASTGIAVTRSRVFVLTNRHFEQMFGYGPDEMLGQTGDMAWADPSQFEDADRLYGPALLRGETIELERTARRKDGSTFIARVRGRAIDPKHPRQGGTAWIVDDITSRREFEQALARARDDAEAANRAKSAFLANTSHELRTPLNGMIGLALLARDEADAARRSQYLDQVVESAQSLAAIISDILDLSKIEAGRLQIEAAPFDLGALLQALQRSYATLAAAHGLALRLEMAPGSDGPVSGDELRVRQVLSNFLANAVKFTPQGVVVLRAERPAGEAWVRLSVQDSGPGIDAAMQARLFEPFTQADQSTTRRFGGTGLGLSICRQLAELMGGRVGVDSRPGEGSTFWAELPLPPAPAGAMAAPVPLPAPAGGAGLAGLQVLVAEDNLVNLLLAAAMLQRWGVQVTQAGDGREAVATVQRAAAEGRPFDAVLMDVQMPLMSGHEATRELRRLGHRLPVIALTAAALVGERETALAAGMDDFLTKPVDAERLQAALVRWCRQPAPG